MNNCVFCNLLKDRNNDLKVNKILYEDDLLVVIPAKGAPIQGWILLVVKKHINGFAELSMDELRHVEKIIEKINKLYLEHFNINSILLEHGSTSEGRHPQSIIHAHMHLLPFNFNECIEKELKEELQVRYINSLLDISLNSKKDYWLYCDPKGEFYSSVNIENVTRSIFMKLVARQIGMETHYDWRNATTNEKFLDKMIIIFEKMNKSII